MPGPGKYYDSAGTIKGIVYGDVSVAWSGKGNAVTLNSAEAYESQSIQTVLTVPDVARDGQLRGVAAVIDRASGKVLNAIQCHFPDVVIKTPESGIPSEETTYWSLQGFPHENPESLCIRRDRLADGSYRTTKILIRH